MPTLRGTTAAAAALTAVLAPFPPAAAASAHAAGGDVTISDWVLAKGCELFACEVG
ncbi:hypothetical protein [Actinomadura rugatobispora]|uniref:Uncharacterized protein n=1 Tax=Actinomadura rugatobispora TaxID=1994 RepID=A0ABW1A3H1_9ACTN|nr:hypothetical protein GCM10010200_013080 [Actinomadura rugatobispora]